MDWSNEPATWKQLKYLKQRGYAPERPLTKAEAVELIRTVGGPAELTAAAVETKIKEITEHRAAYQLRMDVEKARRSLSMGGGWERERLQRELSAGIAKRQEFWADTCREAGKVRVPSMQVHELYQKHGCRFEPPNHNEIQYILDALDAAMPTWDRDNPELFYQTLELNFPTLVCRR